VNPAGRDRLVGDYLDELRGAARGLPRKERDELVASIDEHIFQALSADASESELRTVLERLGDPKQIAQAAYESVEPSSEGAERSRTRSRGAVEWGAILLLPLGGLIVPIIGWIAGVILLWRSPAWKLREKLAGTLLVPGGLGLPVALAIVLADTRTCGSAPAGVMNAGSIQTHIHCVGGASTTSHVLFVLLISLLTLAPVITAIYLARRTAGPHRVVSNA
jgi:hypothetical protein